MEKTADTHRLLKWGDTYHHHRQVPVHLVEVIGRKFIRRALGTDSLKEARRRRTVEDACAEAMVDAAEKGIKSSSNGMSRSLDALTSYVRETVREMDRKASERLALVPLANREQLAELVQDAKMERGRVPINGIPKAARF